MAAIHQFMLYTLNMYSSTHTLMQKSHVKLRVKIIEKKIRVI